MTSRMVDALLDERNRLTAQRAATQGHLWAAEFLLHRLARLLPHLIADSPYNAVARDTLLEEIRELLAEDREHPGPTLDVEEGEAPTSSVTLDDEMADGYDADQDA